VLDCDTDPRLLIVKRVARGRNAGQWAPDGTSLLQMKLRHDMVIHAPTGALLYQFREVALLGRATRVGDLVQPGWTRR